MYENKDRGADYKYIGFELSEEYIRISQARIEYALKNEEENIEDTENGQQMTIFDFIERTTT